MTLRQILSIRGFSLIEISIVLGVAGLIIGGVWVLAANVQENSRVTALVQQTNISILQIRDYYAVRALPTAQVASGTLTPLLRAAGAFPDDMCPANCVSGTVTTIFNIYGGSVLASVPNVSPFNTVDLQHGNLTKRACVQLLMNIGSRSGELGLTQIVTNAGTARTAFPIATATIDTDCSSATNNTVVLRFRLRNS